MDRGLASVHDHDWRIMKKKMSIMGTGSRSMLTEPNAKEIYSNLEAEVLHLADKYDLHLISGMAEGWEEAIAKAAFRNGIPYTVMIPNSGCGNYYWGQNSLFNKNCMSVFNELVEGAHNVIYVCSSIYVTVDGKRVHSNFVRNQAMVDACDGALVYKPESRGTRDAVGRLRKANKPFKVAPFKLAEQTEIIVDTDLKCLNRNGSTPCQGDVYERPSLTGTGKWIARCDFHYDLRVQEEDKRTRAGVYDVNPPEWFDPAAAGETW